MALLLVILEPSVARAAAEAPSPTGSFSPAGDRGEPAPPPLPPPDPLPPGQAPQESPNGTVFQSWDNSSIGPVSVVGRISPSVRDNGSVITYSTSYGTFEIDKVRPYFVSIDGAAKSVFLGRYDNTFLVPRNGGIDAATSSLLEFHYDLYRGGKDLGQMNVTYSFAVSGDKISVVFTPADGVGADHLQIIWLTFTLYGAVETIRGFRTFEELPIGCADWLDGDTRTGFCSTRLALVLAFRSQKEAGAEMRLDATDSNASWVNTYGGRFAFLGLSGNFGLTVFARGVLSVDPTILSSAEPSDATSFSYQRKTFYDGTAYWAFWKGVVWLIGNPPVPVNTIWYARSSDGGRTFTRFSLDIPGFPQNMAFSFTVINYGRDVAILWIPSSDTHKVLVVTGRLGVDSIAWDPSRTLLTTSDSQYQPIVATFTPQGEIAFTLGVLSGSAHRLQLARYTCTYPGSDHSRCYSGPPPAVGDVYSGGYFALGVPAAFNGDTGSVAVVYGVDMGGSLIRYDSSVAYASGEIRPCPVPLLHSELESVQNNWREGLFSASPTGPILRQSGEYVSVFMRIGDAETNTWWVAQRLLDMNCEGYVDEVTDPIFSSSLPPSYITSGTQGDGRTLYLFFRWGSPDSMIYYSSILPGHGKTGPTTDGIVSGYRNPTHLTVAPYSASMAPLLFTKGYDGGNPSTCVTQYCVLFLAYPLPTDELNSPGPWVQRLGVNLIDAQGAQINPASGLLTAKHDLYSFQGRGTTFGVSLIYTEPSLWLRWSGKDTPYRYHGPPAAYGKLLNTVDQVVYVDLPWIETTNVPVLHLMGGIAVPIIWGETVPRDGCPENDQNRKWFNSTATFRFSLLYDCSTTTYTLNLASGEVMTFDSDGLIVGINPDATGNNEVSVGYYTQGLLKSVYDGSGRSVWFLYSAGLLWRVADADGNMISEFHSVGVPSGCSGGTATDSGTLEVLDGIGRKMTYSVCHYKLTDAVASSGGSAKYGYATYEGSCTNGPCAIWKGTDVYSLPITRVDVYNETGRALKAKDFTMSYVVVNGEIVKSWQLSYDHLGRIAGSQEYLFDFQMKSSTVRTLDISGYALYYDMETLTTDVPPKMKDNTGNGNHGTITGTIDVAGRVGRARRFGSASRIEVVSLLVPGP